MTNGKKQEADGQITNFKCEQYLVHML